MDLVVITTLIAVVTLILQIVILANQKKNAKIISDFISERQKSHHSDRDKFHDRRDGNFNKNRRGNGPQNSNKNAPAQQVSSSTSVDSVEKSLRDINLKLKNAERDQEAARKRISDGIGKDGQRPRGNRDHNRGGKDGHRRDRDRDRNNRGNWRDRNGGDRSENSSRPQQEHPAAVNESAAAAEIAPSVTPSLPELNPVDFDTDLEHGRKFAVKRRPLAEEAAAPAVGQAGGQGGEEKTPVQEFSAEAPSSNDSEISFGRR